MVQGLGRPAAESDRLIAWAGQQDVLGLARTPRGKLEIFLVGPQLEARSRRVREALEYQRWFRADGAELLANRILLPAAGHFEQVAAFLTTELLRNGAIDDLALAFGRTEPLIELTIEELLIADDTLLGLCGEMLVLRSLLRAAPRGRADEALESWKGHRDTPRDFQLGAAGIEVKTTTRASSSHFFRGVGQLEPGHGVDGADESSYMLVSIGLEWSTDDDVANTTALPELIDEVARLTRSGLGPSGEAHVKDLLDRVREYGTPITLGYDHHNMRDNARYQRRFRTRFVRGYDLSDDAVALLTTDDLRARPFIEAESLHVRVSFPDRIRGDINPVVGLGRCAERAWRDA